MNELEGIDTLRSIVKVLDSRNESMNADKTLIQLVNEATKYLNYQISTDKFYHG